MTKNGCVKLAQRPTDAIPTPAMFRYEECEYPEVEDNEVLLKTLYLATDPLHRILMLEYPGLPFVKALVVDKVMPNIDGVGVVVESKNENFKIGNIVINNIDKSPWPWQNYWSVAGGSGFIKVVKTDEPEYEISYYGLPGLTAILGMQEKGFLNYGTGKGKSFVVSGAAGSCGHLAGQFARVYGCSPVIGICGSEAKCNMLTNDLKFTNAINYKTENIGERIEELCPNGVDVYFDIVGGSVSEAVVSQMNKDTHIIFCGQISQYNADNYNETSRAAILKMCKNKNITREGFTSLVWADKYETARVDLRKMKHDEGVEVLQTLYEGLESLPKAFCDMFLGKNMMIKIASQ